MAARKTKTEDTNVAEQQVAERQPEQYRIICRNKITKQIGGVDFKGGVGYTFDGYAASWFAAKDGYTVERPE